MYVTFKPNNSIIINQAFRICVQTWVQTSTIHTHKKTKLEFGILCNTNLYFLIDKHHNRIQPYRRMGRDLLLNTIVWNCIVSGKCKVGNCLRMISEILTRKSGNGEPFVTAIEIQRSWHKVHFCIMIYNHTFFNHLRVKSIFDTSVCMRYFPIYRIEMIFN